MLLVEVFPWNNNAVHSLPTLLLLDEQNLVPRRVEEEVARRFHVRRTDRTGAAKESAVLALVATPLARNLRIDGLPPDLPRIVLVTGQPSVADVVAAIHAGAQDLLPADDAEAVLAAVGAALETRRLQAELLRLAETQPPEIAPQLLGESPPMVRLRAQAARVALSDITVLVSGPRGSGKGLVARVLHDGGARRAGPFVTLDASVRPGAVGASTNPLLAASAGTLFLDEVGELSLDQQEAVLRAITDRRVVAPGQDRPAAFDARVVASTSKNLEQEVRAGRFREDLFLRLNVITLRTPALAERGLDVLLLAQHFVRLASTEARPLLGLTPGAARALMGHSWPGNVSELRQCIAAAVDAAKADHVGSADLPARLGDHKLVPPPESLKPLEVVERAHILCTLNAVDGNRALASRILKLDRKTLYRKLKSYAIEETRARSRLDSAPG